MESFLVLGLKEDQILEDREIEKIVKEDQFQKTWDFLLKYCTLRPRSRNEVNLWIRRKKVHESLIKDLIKKLKRLELIDDQAFALWWIEQRTSFKPRGKRALKFELRQKGIKTETIDKVLSQVNLNEEKLAKGLIAKKSYLFSKYSGREAWKKKSQYLARKGFDWEIIEKTLGKR